MLGWIWRVFIGRFSTCHHEWETVADGKAVDLIGGKKVAIGQIYTLHCKKCGEINNQKPVMIQKLTTTTIPKSKEVTKKWNRSFLSSKIATY